MEYSEYHQVITALQFILMGLWGWFLLGFAGVLLFWKTNRMKTAFCGFGVIGGLAGVIFHSSKLGII